MTEALQDDVIKLPAAAPGLSRFDIQTFTQQDSPWAPHKELLAQVICTEMAAVVAALRHTLGDDCNRWRWCAQVACASAT